MEFARIYRHDSGAAAYSLFNFSNVCFIRFTLNKVPMLPTELTDNGMSRIEKQTCTMYAAGSELSHFTTVKSRQLYKQSRFVIVNTITVGTLGP